MRLALLALAFGCNAMAQDYRDWTPMIARGTHVRVEGEGMPRLDGTYLDMRGDSLRLALGRGGVTVATPMARVVAIDVSQGRERAKWAFRGILGGGLGGAVVLTALVYEDAEGSLGIPVAFLAGAFVGSVLGGVAGAIWAPESWSRYRNPDR